MKKYSNKFLTTSRYFMKNATSNNIFKHIIGVGFYIFFEYNTIRLTGTSVRSIEKYLIVMLVHVAFFYLYALLLIPLGRRKVYYILLPGYYIVLILLHSLTVAFMGIGYDYIFFKLSAYRFSYDTLQLFLWHCASIFLFSYAYTNVIRNYKIEKEARLKEKQQAENEQKILALQNALLASKINPHFLYNALSFIYYESAKAHTALSYPIASLIDLLDYSLLSGNNGAKVTIQRELECIQQYIDWYLSFHNNSIHCKLNIKSSTYDRENNYIIPMLLVQLVENVFSHGELKDSENPAIISIEMAGNTLSFKTVNKVITSEIAGYGIGMNATKTLLDYYYRNNYSLHYGYKKDDFVVNLTLTL